MVKALTGARSRGVGARSSLQHLQGLLSLHQVLLGDARRNRAFQRALAQRVRPGASVLDLGAGSGIWAVTAARLGARSVVAVEREPLLVPVIRRLAEENGVADRVRVVLADARRLALPRRFDVVVSETVGSAAFDEGIVGLMARARDRFLLPGGALVPQQLALRAAPVRAVSRGARAPGLPATTSFDSLAVHVPRPVPPLSLRALARSVELLRVDLCSARPDEALPLARARYAVRDGGAVAGLAVWVEADLAPGVTLSTRAGTHWSPLLLPVDRLPTGAGRVEFEVDWTPERRRWRVRFQRGAGEGPPIDYSPLFPWGWLRAKPPRGS
jgi:SAM-dependent methyltransferase